MHRTRGFLDLCTTNQRIVSGSQLLDDGGSRLEETSEDVGLREGAGIVGEGEGLCGGGDGVFGWVCREKAGWKVIMISVVERTGWLT